MKAGRAYNVVRLRSAPYGVRERLHRHREGPDRRWRGMPLPKSARSSAPHDCGELTQPPAPRTWQDVSLANAEGNTPLHWAACNGQCGAMRLLMMHGASASALNRPAHAEATSRCVHRYNRIIESAGVGAPSGCCGGAYMTSFAFLCYTSIFIQFCLAAPRRRPLRARLLTRASGNAQARAHAG